MLQKYRPGKSKFTVVSLFFYYCFLLFAICSRVYSCVAYYYVTFRMHNCEPPFAPWRYMLKDVSCSAV